MDSFKRSSYLLQITGKGLQFCIKTIQINFGLRPNACRHFKILSKIVLRPGLVLRSSSYPKLKWSNVCTCVGGVVCCRVETERSEWMKERDDKLENMSVKMKELKASLKERNKVVDELERRLLEQTAALETGRSQVAEVEATSVELQTKLAESKRTIDERDDQLQALRDELTMVSLSYFLSFCLSVCLSVCLSICLSDSSYCHKAAKLHCEPKNTPKCFCRIFHKTPLILIKFGVQCLE